MKIPKIEKKFEFMARADKSETDIYMYGCIGSWWGITAEEVKDMLLRVNTKVINVHLNSEGGDAFDGVAIHNLLKQHSATVNIYIDGLAASAASTIAMAGDTIYMPKNTMLMIHEAWTYAAGNAKEMRKIADNLEKVNAAITESYFARFIGERKELEKLLEEEACLTAEECKALGFCDEILELKDIENTSGGNNAANNMGVDDILNKYMPGYTASVNRKTLRENAAEMRKKFVANTMQAFIVNLSKKENE